MNKPPTPIQQVINYYFELKGWENKEKDFYLKRKIIYARFTRPAKDLLRMCDNDVETAKARLRKLKKQADEKGFSWGIETVIKRWFEKDEEYDGGVRALEIQAERNKKRYGW